MTINTTNDNGHILMFSGYNCYVLRLVFDHVKMSYYTALSYTDKSMTAFYGLWLFQTIAMDAAWSHTTEDCV